MALPRSDLPWGVTQAWFDTDAKIVGIINEPIIRMIGKKKYDLVINTPGERILSLCHIYDNEGNELVQDKDRDVKYTVLLNRKNPLPAPTAEDEEVLGCVKNVLNFRCKLSWLFCRAHFYPS